MIIERILSFLTNSSKFVIGFKIICVNNINLEFNRSLKTICHRRPSSLRYSSNDIIQYADPFLIKFGDDLYCFYESKSRYLPGEIHVAGISEDGFSNISKCELGIDCHLSFPFVHFDDLNNVHYMIPETAALNEVSIYKSVDFPTKWNKTKTILIGKYVDSHIIHHNDLYYLFTTEKLSGQDTDQFDYKLLLFYSKTFDGPYILHPSSPLSVGRKYSRSAGSILKNSDGFFRFAQDCSISYGREISVFRIKELSEVDYKEELVQDQFIESVFKHKYGGHHISCCMYYGNNYFAVDFNYKDSYWQRFLNLIQK